MGVSAAPAAPLSTPPEDAAAGSAPAAHLDPIHFGTLTAGARPNYVNLIRQSWLLFIRHPVLWVLGVLPGISYISTVFTFKRGDGLGLACLSLVVLLFFFILSTFGEASFITMTDHLVRTGHPLPLATVWSRARSQLGRLIVLFLGIALLMILFILPLIVIPANTPLRGVLIFLLAYAIGEIYALSTRSVVLEDRAVLPALRTAWGLIRTNLGPMVLITLITMVVELVRRGVTNLLTGGLDMLRVETIFSSTDFPAGLDPFATLIFASVLVLVATPFGAFSSVLWTLFYRERTAAPPQSFAPAVPSGLPPPPGAP
jgi:hypothetical protein